MPYPSISEYNFNGEGITVQQVGVKYPIKGFPQSALVHAVASIKRVLIMAIKQVKNPFFVIGALTSWSKLLDEFLAYADMIFLAAQEDLGELEFFEKVYNQIPGRPFSVVFLRKSLFSKDGYLLPEKYCVSVKEFHRVGMLVLDKLGKGARAKKFLSILCMFLEFDDSYRYRTQDAWGTAKSIKGGFKVLLEREDQINVGMYAKLQAINTVYNLASLHPVFRKAVKLFEGEVDWARVDLDDHDFYHSMPKGNYSFRGFNFKERTAMRDKIDINYINQLNAPKVYTALGIAR